MFNLLLDDNSRWTDRDACLLIDQSILLMADTCRKQTPGKGGGGDQAQLSAPC